MRNSFICLHSLLIVLGALLLGACASTKKIAYFQDLLPGEGGFQVTSPIEIRISPEDKISIVVNSKDPQLADLFNLPVVGHRIGQTLTTSMNQNQQISGYTVDSRGNIDFPVLGEIKVQGMNRAEVAAAIKSELVNRNLVKDPVVTVEFMNLNVAIMGEVNNPGRFSIDRDKITILDAVSMAGDLTIYGKRENVLVLRRTNGSQKVYRVNLCSAEQLYGSPAYYLQQNDVVYVEPNSTRARQSNVNGNNVISTSFWLSVASLLTTVIVLLVK